MPLWSVEDWRVRIAFSYSALGIWRPVKLRGYGGRTKSKPFVSSYPNQRHLSSFIARSLQCLSAAILMLLLLSINMTDNLGPLSHLLKWGQKLVTMPKTNQLLVSSLKCAMLAFSYFKLLLLLSGDVETNPGPPDPDTPTLEDAMAVLATLANQWQLVGRLLDISYHLLQAIAKDHTTDKDGLKKMLEKWLNEKNPLPSWRKLAIEVEQVDSSVALSIAQYIPEAKESDEDADEHIEAYEKALETELSLNLKYLKLILLGVPRAGKTSMKRRLVGEKARRKECSTGVSEGSSVIVTQVDPSMAIIDFSKPKSTWTTVGHDAKSSENVTGLGEETLMIYQFIKDTLNKQQSAGTADPVQQQKREGDEQTVAAGKLPASNTVDQSRAQDGGARLNEGPSFDNESHDKRNVPTSRVTDTGTPDAAAETKKQLETLTETGKDVPSRKDIDMTQIDEVFDAFNNVMRQPSAEREKLKAVLEKTVLLNLVDTGGQLAFLEMLPLLTIGPALYLIFFKLNEVLTKDRVNVQFCPEEGGKELQLEESYTTREVIHQVVSSIACCSMTSKHENEGKSAAATDKDNHVSREKIASSQRVVAMLVGTHKSELGSSKEEVEKRIAEINSELNDELRELLFDSKNPAYGILREISENKPAFTVDNFQERGEDINDVRGRLEKEIKDRFKDLPIPASWFMFSIILRWMKKPVLTLQECEEIGERLKMKDTKLALWFLHHCIGIVMWYNEVEGMENLVICNPQLIFDLITEMITKTIDHQNDRNVQDFKQEGRFKLQDIPEISELDKNTLVKLLEDRKIIAKISPSGSASSTNNCTEYFMPAVLPPAEDKEEELRIPPSDRNPAPVMIHFTCGIVPVGVFCATVADLVARVKEPRWTLTKNPRRRNRVTFRVSWYRVRYHVTLIATPKHYAIYLTAIDPVWKPTTICHHVLETVCGALDRVINEMKHICTLIPHSEKNIYQIGFRCPHDPNVSEHMVVNEPSCSEPCCKSVLDTWISYLKHESSMKCLKEESVKEPDPPLSDQLERGCYRCWFEESTKFLQDPVPCITKHLCKLKIVGKGKDVKFSVSAEGKGTLTYQWVKDGKDITDTPSKCEGFTSPTLHLTSVEQEHEGLYWCVVSNKAGPTESEKTRLVIRNRWLRYWIAAFVLCLALSLPFLLSIVGPKLSTLLNKTTMCYSNQHRYTPAYTKPSLYEAPTLYQLTNFKMDGSTEALNIPQRIAADYQLFGTLLLNDVYGNEMKAIEKGRDVDEINMEVLSRWLNGKGKHPITWKTLIDTLYDTKLAVLAKQIEDVLA